MNRFGNNSEEQKAVLRRQVSIAMELNLPIVIHSRDSEQDIIEELEKVCKKYCNSPVWFISYTLYALNCSLSITCCGLWSAASFAALKLLVGQLERKLNARIALNNDSHDRATGHRLPYRITPCY